MAVAAVFDQELDQALNELLDKQLFIKNKKRTKKQKHSYQTF
jgi:hypothetical protein